MNFYTCIQASWPLIAAIWAGVQPLDVVTLASAPCHSNQWRHWRKKCHISKIHLFIHHVNISLWSPLILGKPEFTRVNILCIISRYGNQFTSKCGHYLDLSAPPPCPILQTEVQTSPIVFMKKLKFDYQRELQLHVKEDYWCTVKFL